MTTSKEKIIAKAIEILKSDPDGVRYSNLVREIHKEFTKISVNTIQGTVWNLETRVPNEVYKPARGLFRHATFREEEAQRNVTMVVFHGAKKSDSSLAQLIGDVFKELKNAVGSSYSKVFDPFDDDQIHATLIGMEVDVVGRQFYGHWFHQNRNGTKRPIDFQRFVELLRSLAQRKPIFTIRFGGFSKAYCTCVGKSAEGWACSSSGAEFHSCDRSAYEGSFYAYAPGPAMLTGWPVRTSENLNEFPHSLYDFRLAAEGAGFLDKYHSDKAPHWMDDDCYIKLGSFIQSISNLGDVEEHIRKYLSERKAVTVDITVEDVSILLYKDPSLKKETIIYRISLSDAVTDEHRIIQLYHRLLE